MKVVTCQACGETKPINRKPRTGCCEECNRARFVIRERATSLLHQAVLKGRIAPARQLQCVDCGCAATDYDHRNYEYPYQVEPTCRRCNLRRGAGAFPREVVLHVRRNIESLQGMWSGKEVLRGIAVVDNRITFEMMMKRGVA